MPQLVLVKELMTALVANEESFGECGMRRQFDDLLSRIISKIILRRRLLHGHIRSRCAAHI
jgi:hypothetical protein